MSNSKKAWDSQAKWENSGKDGNDNYQAKDGYYKEKVGTHKAYGMQEKSPKGASSGSTQHSGDAISGWNQPGSHKNQAKWGAGGEAEVKVNLGENAGYLGHFNSSKILDEGHNDGEDNLLDLAKSIRAATGSPQDKPSKSKKSMAPSDEGSFSDFMFNDSKALHQDD